MSKAKKIGKEVKGYTFVGNFSYQLKIHYYYCKMLYVSIMETTKKNLQLIKRRKKRQSKPQHTENHQFTREDNKRERKTIKQPENNQDGIRKSLSIICYSKYTQVKLSNQKTQNSKMDFKKNKAQVTSVRKPLET